MKKQPELIIEKPAEGAAGLKAIYISILQIANSMSFFKAFNILSRLNQKKGIDCPAVLGLNQTIDLNWL